MVTKDEISFIVGETMKFYGIKDGIIPTREWLTDQIFEKILDKISEEL